ncbi:MAG: DUF58 domain-containing protein [Bacteroides sp.]|nr:DUF58 domain-containing protein [Prevotella sp.]MCM1408525.1 DUF58 domain-containing protein [Treponema brennaborense]MCM1470761.1 DUF58 domain-containing protein [Bacteroides sp.]
MTGFRSASSYSRTSDRSALAEKAMRLRLSALAVAGGLRAGSFSSLRRGQGMEFCGVRDYFYGDDMRSIDWNVTSRMGKPFVKLFEEEREITFFLIADYSLSMSAGGSAKLRGAAEVGEVFTLAAQQMNSPVGAVFFDGGIRFSSAPRNGAKHSMMVFNAFETFRPPRTNGGSALKQALQGAQHLLKNRSLVVILSDFRCAGYENSLAHLAVKHDVLALRFTEPADFCIADVGSALFYDPESGCRRFFPTGSRGFSKAWKEYGVKSLEEWRHICMRHGAVPIALSAADDPVRELSAFLSSGGIKNAASAKGGAE